LSVAGQELYKRFVKDGEEIDKELENYPTVRWFRAAEMDAFPAELLELHEGSLELEERGATTGLQVGENSSNGRVEHIGESVFVEKNTIAIDPDSKVSLPTITRLDQRETARLAVTTVDDPRNPPKVTCVGQAGIGKTRGGLAYNLQLLLWRGEAVMRVGYKDEMVFLFLPDEDGVYKVWRTDSSAWSISVLAKDARTYALIDPPEAVGAAYKDSARCHVIKWASNNAAKHYKNWEKDGMLLFTDMPSEAEVLVMIPYLWTEDTPFPSQHFDTDEAKEKEITKRCQLIGCVLRIVFNHKNFEAHLKAVVLKCKTDGMTMDVSLLHSYYQGSMTNADADESSLSSLMYILRAKEGDASHQKMSAVLTPLASFTLRARLMVKVSEFDGTRAFKFEDFVSTLLLGGTVGGVELPARTQVNGTSHENTSQLIRALVDGDKKFVVAHDGYVVLDMATAINSWYNAKVGKSTPTIGSGAFVTLMTKQLELAREVDGGLEWVEDKKTAITLTFVRNNSSDKWDFEKKFGAKHASMDFEKVEAFFTEHVKVKVLDSSNLMPLEKREVEVMERTSNLVDEYERVTEAVLK
ncbi:MAG: hypothetical protein OSB10_10045, partial [Planctomycetota bacterium]|nr:hypothetical protein [Planctomycetota bacterium]